MFFKKIISFSRESSLANFNKLFSSSPNPTHMYLILGNLGLRFFITIKILSWPFLLSSLATVIILGKLSFNIFSAFSLYFSSIDFGLSIPGNIMWNFWELIPTLIANSLVKFEFAIIKLAFSVLFTNLLFNEEFTSWLISLEWSRQKVLVFLRYCVFNNSKLFQWSAIKALMLELSFKKLFTKFAFLYFLKSFIPFTLSISIDDLLSKYCEFLYSNAKTFTGPWFTKFLDNPPIKFWIPPTSGGKFLVTIRNII